MPQPFEKIIPKILESFQGGLNPLSNFLLPYIPTVKAEDFTARFGNVRDGKIVVGV